MKTYKMTVQDHCWKQASALPFRFVYGGVDSREIMGGWQRDEEADVGGRRQIHFRDPVTGLRVTADIRTFDSFKATEWVLRFANESGTDTPLLEKIEPLHLLVEGEDKKCDFHYAIGAQATMDDFEPRTAFLWKGSSHRISSTGGRSAFGNLPFFNLQIGEGGLIGAIGWSGNWATDVARDWHGAVEIAAGMQRTRIALRPGEEMRSPSILLMSWEGDRDSAQNTWRRLLLAHYSPHYDDEPIVLPLCYCVWGTAAADEHLSRIRRLTDAGIGMDVYWIDAGWYGNQPLVENGTVFNTAWPKNRGNWWPSEECYPDGMKPIADVLRQKNIGLLLWFEIEVADVGSDILVNKSNWFFPGRRTLNLGNPDTCCGVIEIISKSITDYDLAWYRQDFNSNPEADWAEDDEPNRIGMIEIRHIEGLYRFWDKLRERHPQLRIDNCASGGRRIDIETLRRSVPLWRSDYQCNPSFDPIGSQRHTAGLAPWVPLSAGVVGTPNTYALRSAYSAGLTIEGGMCGPKEFPQEWLRQAVEEFHEVRNYFYGDYYPIRPFQLFDSAWLAWQLHRPDLNAGIVIVLCRQHLPAENCPLTLRALELEAKYTIEIRYGLGAATTRTVVGGDLASLVVTIADRPGSALILYKKLDI